MSAPPKKPSSASGHWRTLRERIIGRRTHPIPPPACADGFEESVAFYESIGFCSTTYREVPPVPVCGRWQENLCRLQNAAGFEPANSYGTAIVGVRIPDALLPRLCGGLARGSRQAPGYRGDPDHSPRKKYGTSARLQRRRPGRELAASLEAGESEETGKPRGERPGASSSTSRRAWAIPVAMSRGAEDARERPDPLRRKRQPGGPRPRVLLPRGAGGTYEDPARRGPRSRPRSRSSSARTSGTPSPEFADVVELVDAGSSE